MVMSRLSPLLTCLMTWLLLNSKWARELLTLVSAGCLYQSMSVGLFNREVHVAAPSKLSLTQEAKQADSGRVDLAGFVSKSAENVPLPDKVISQLAASVQLQPPTSCIDLLWNLNLVMWVHGDPMGPESIEAVYGRYADHCCPLRRYLCCEDGLAKALARLPHIFMLLNVMLCCVLLQ